MSARVAGFPNPTEVQKQIISSIERNAGKPGFDVGIRSIYSAPADKYVTMNPFVANIFKPFNTHTVNDIQPAPLWSEKFNDYPWEDVGGHRQHHEMHEVTEAYRARSYFHPPYRGPWMIMSSEELATLWHPPTASVRTSGPCAHRLDHLVAARRTSRSSMLFGYAGFLYEAIRAHVMERPARACGRRARHSCACPWRALCPALRVPDRRKRRASFRRDVPAGGERARRRARRLVGASSCLRLRASPAPIPRLQAGRYAFPAPEGAAIVLYRLANGATETPAKRVTFPEGSTAREMSEALAGPRSRASTPRHSSRSRSPTRASSFLIRTIFRKTRRRRKR